MAVPIALWHEIESERETAYLLHSQTMKQRLFDALESTNIIPFEEVRAKLGILTASTTGLGVVDRERPQNSYQNHQTDSRNPTLAL